MRVQVKIDPKTARRVKSGFKRLERDSPRKAANLVKSTALVVETQAAHLAPVDTGRLRQSIRMEPAGPTAIEVGTNVKYSYWQEVGTSRFAGKHYMEKGFRAGYTYMALQLKNGGFLR